jgi:simple sugar transport system ATP-binding protein
MGENGAGKSTLIKVLTGALRRDRGEIRLDGQSVEINTPGQARALGIGTVYQEVNLVPTMSVTKNLTLGRQPTRFGVISWRSARDVAKKRLQRLNIDIDIERPLGAYSVAIQQLIAIARALEDDTRVLVLDEPTASLDAPAESVLFHRYAAAAHALAARCGTITLLISHRFSTVRDADLIIVLDHGQVLESGSHKQLMALGGTYAELFELQARAYA